MAETTTRNASNLTRNAKPVTKEDARPPVPQRHRNQLGKADGTTNPYGDGEPSKVSTVKNGKGGW